MVSIKPYRCIIDTCSNENIKNNKKLLSITIPTYKRFDLLKETLHSVYENKFEFDIEVIIVDNDPDNEDLAQSVMHEFLDKPFKYYKNTKNYGMFGNWNQCLALASGEYITILHDDDLLKHNFGDVLSKVLSSDKDFYAFNCNVLDERPESNKPKTHALYSIVKGGYTYLRNYRYNFRRKIDIKRLFFLNVFMGTLAVVFKREKAIELDGFNEDYYPISDYHFWAKWIMTYGPIYIEPDFVARYRIRENETMRQETIDLFIEKDFLLRKNISAHSKEMAKYDRYVNLLKLRVRMLFNFSWSRDEQKYKKNAYTLMKYFCIRIICAIIFI